MFIVKLEKLRCKVHYLLNSSVAHDMKAESRWRLEKAEKLIQEATIIELGGKIPDPPRRERDVETND